MVKANQQPLVLHAKSPPKKTTHNNNVCGRLSIIYKPQDGVNSVTINEPKNSDFPIVVASLSKV